MLRVIANESWLINLDSEVGVKIVANDIMIRDIKCATLSDGQSAAFFRNLRFIKWPVKPTGP